MTKSKKITNLQPYSQEEIAKMKRVRHGNGIQLYGKNNKEEICRYEGQWELDKRTGRGSAVFPDDSKYSGNFKAGTLHGHGHFYWTSGHSYNGEWVYGRMEGNGEFTYPSGKVLKGRFIDNHYVDVFLYQTIQNFF